MEKFKGSDAIAFLPKPFTSEATDAEVCEGHRYSSAGCLRKPLDLDKLGPMLAFLMQTGRVS